MDVGADVGAGEEMEFLNLGSIPAETAAAVAGGVGGDAGDVGGERDGVEESGFGVVGVALERVVSHKVVDETGVRWLVGVDEEEEEEGGDDYKEEREGTETHEREREREEQVDYEKTTGSRVSSSESTTTYQIPHDMSCFFCSCFFLLSAALDVNKANGIKKITLFLSFFLCMKMEKRKRAFQSLFHKAKLWWNISNFLL